MTVFNIQESGEPAYRCVESSRTEREYVTPAIVMDLDRLLSATNRVYE